MMVIDHVISLPFIIEDISISSNEDCHHSTTFLREIRERERERQRFFDVEAFFLTYLSSVLREVVGIFCTNRTNNETIIDFGFGIDQPLLYDNGKI